MKIYGTINNGKLPVGVQVVQEGTILRLYFDYKRFVVTHDDKVQEEQYECENVDVVSDSSYSGIVSAIVNDRYSNDKVQAILANYAEATAEVSTLSLSPEKKEEYLNEYADFQKWRQRAKELAKEVLNKIG